MQVAICKDSGCSSAVLNTVDWEGDVGKYSSVAVGTDGLALFSYYDATNKHLKVAHCENTNVILFTDTCTEH